MTSATTPFDNRPYFFLLDKPQGITSYDVIRQVKPYLFDKLGKGKGRSKLKIGHFGTLDPFASGLLLVGTGKALKLTELIHQQLTKSYVALGIAGTRTLTGDREGEVVTSDGSGMSENQLKDILRAFPRDYMQKPSYFSALKHEGKPLYEYAREGIFIDKPAVARVVHSLEHAETYHDKKHSFVCEVSTGTYVRALWEDICDLVNSVGHLEELRRVKIGPLAVSEAKSLSDINSADDLVALSPKDILRFDCYELDREQYKKISHGAAIDIEKENKFLWLSYEGELCALVRNAGHHTFKLEVNFIAQ